MENQIDSTLLSRSTSFNGEGSISTLSQASSVLGTPIPELSLRRSLSLGQFQTPPIFLPRPRERTSWVWKHGTLFQGPNRNGILKDRWRCNLCMKPFCSPNVETAANFADSTTKNAINHLVKLHNFYQNGDVRGLPVESSTADTSNTLRDHPQINSVKAPLLLFNSDVFKQLFIRWIITNNIPFLQAVSPALRFLLMYLCAVQATFVDVGKALPTSQSTVSSWIFDSFTENRIRIKTLLSNSVSSIHLSFDLWTSPNNLALLGVVAHWLSENGILYHGLLGLRRILGAHSGENQGSMVWTVITEFEIQKTLGYFTLDNASNNHTALRYIETQYNNIASVLPQSNLPIFNQHLRYIRCYGHILNLVVKVFLYGKKSSQLATIEEKMSIEKENLEMDRWRKIGPLGKLRNITLWIQGSPQRREAFCNVVNTLLGAQTQARTLILGNVTRWTGDYDGLNRALGLRHAIDFHMHQLLRDNPKVSIEKDLLTHNDWHILQLVFDFLTPFRNETLALEGHRTQGALFDVYPSLESLTRHLHNSQSNLVGQSQFLDTSFLLARQKLEKYYSLSQLSPIICASIVLNPNMDNFFDDKELGWGLRPEWTIKGKGLVQNLWINSYKHLSLHNTSIASPGSPKRDLNHSTNLVRNFKKPRLNLNATDDELQRYYLWLSKNEDYIEDPILWWIKARQLYPRLSILALDTFSIPAMSAECERVFSSAKQCITDRRNRLDEKTIEAGECQKSWARAGLISFTSASEISDILLREERNELTLHVLT